MLFGLISVLCAIEPRLVHWFLVPVFVCGLIVGRDAVDWMSGRVDPFDPRGVLGMLCLHLFITAPLLLVYWDLPYDVAPRPEDWRPWLGIMAAINAAGLFVYRGVSTLVFGRSRAQARAGGPARPARRWDIDPKRALGVLVPALLLAGVAQMYLWLAYGGISGQISGYKSMAGGEITGRFKYQLLAGAFPVLLLMLMSVVRRKRSRESGKYSRAFLLLAVTFVIYFVVDGLRGSRSATIWTLFWATGIIHYFWRKLSARLLMAGVIPLVLFMYLYGFYKSYGDQVWRVYSESSGVSELSERSGRTMEHLLIRDLSRVDIQAFVLYRMLSGTVPYELTWGATYAETLPRSLIPRTLWPDRPIVPRKGHAGAQLHFGGPNPYGEGFSKVYGLAGEGLLNFHVVGAIVAFGVFGAAMGFYRKKFVSWPEYDARLFIAPFMANWFLAALVGDFDNLVTFTMTKAVFPVVVLLLIVRRRVPRAAELPAQYEHSHAMQPSPTR